MKEQKYGPDLTDLEQLILQLGYSKNIATTVITFLRNQHKASAIDNNLDTIFIEIQNFVRQRLKPRYQAKTIDRLFALVDITIETRESDIYFTKHLFDPEQEDARLRLEYAMMRRMGEDNYLLAVVERGVPRIVLQQLKLEDCLDTLEKDRDFAPSSYA